MIPYTFNELPEKIKYKYSFSEVSASIDEIDLGILPITPIFGLSEVPAWKDRVIMATAGSCRSIRLRTKCGCIKDIDLPIGYDLDT